METAEQSPAPSAPSATPTVTTARAARLRKRLRRPYIALRSLLQLLLLAWAALAIYYSNLPWPWTRLALAFAFAAFAIWALWLKRSRKTLLAFAATYGTILIWFTAIPPSHDRPWRPDAATLPRAVINGDRIRIDAVRNFTYRTREDFTPRYEQREFSLARVASLDLFISYWQPGPIAHTFVSFNFDDGTRPLCISIEARPETGETFAALPSMFKQFELIYVVGDEHDLVGSRASHRDEDLYLYRIRATPDGARRLLEVYLDRINDLADRPQFYHLLSNNCTVNILRYGAAAGAQHGGFDIRHLLNGRADRYLYDTEWVDTTLPFEELRRRSRITDAAKAAAHTPDFSTRIRAALPRASIPESTR